MKISRHDKLLLFEMELVALVMIIILGYVFYMLMYAPLLYLIVLLLGFAFYFWMVYEEKIHKKGKKHAYFEHTSSYVMLGQTGLVLSLFFLQVNINFLLVIFMVISVIMYSVALSRVILYKAVFRK